MQIEDHGDHLTIVGDDKDRQHFKDIIAKARALPVYSGSLDPAAIRKSGLDLADSALALPCPADIDREWITANGVRCCWFRAPGGAGGDPILYLHGGGYVGGSVEASRGIAAALATAFAAPVLAVDYRQAPESPYPAAVDDSRAAYAWLIDQTERPVIVVGDSAGGALAVIVALDAARTGRRPARAAIASSGWFDLRMRGESWQTSKGHDLVTIELGQMFVSAYLDGADPETVNALLLDGLEAAPPLLIQMGGAEGPLSDAFAYAAKARGQGVAVTFEVYQDMPHNWVKFASPISESAFQRMAAWAEALD